MSVTRSGDHRVRAFMVRLPSGAVYWTVLDEDLAVVAAADAFLRQGRVGRDGAGATTKGHAGAIALFLRWCARTGRDWQAGAAHLGLFMTWLLHAGPQVSGAGAFPGAAVLTGPGSAPARSARRVNGILAAVRGMIVHAVTEGTAPGHLVRLLFEVADDVDLPAGARAEDGSTGWRGRARPRAQEAGRPGGPGRGQGHRRGAGRLLLGAGPADRAAYGAGGAAPRRGARAAPQRRALAG